jgi:uncharacterized protein
LSSQRIGDWIQTFKGIPFWPLDPRAEEIAIEDIAHALSNQCRFSGHVKKFYSVAEHSILVSNLCKTDDALWGLLHDASEAYLQDMARPVKHQPEMAGYRAAEKSLQGRIVEKFGLPDHQPESVTYADQVMLAIEARDLMSPLLPGWEKWLDKIPSDLDWSVRFPLDPPVAKNRFLKRFEALNA